MTEYRKNQFNYVLKKIKEKDKLNSVGVDVEIQFIKDKVENLSNDDADNVDVDIDNNVIIMMINIIRLLDSD